MASFLLGRQLTQIIQTQASQQVPLTAHEALSGISGTISLVSWIFVLVPQFIENYRNQSAEAVSIPFIIIWFIGDAANLGGAIWAELVPTVIATAVYFCFTDFAIGIQCTYYNIKNKRKERLRAASAETAQVDASEDEPLLSRRGSGHSAGLSGSHRPRRRSSNVSHSVNSQSGNVQGTLNRIAEDDVSRNESSAKREWIKNTICISLVFALGAIAWGIAYGAGVWKPVPSPRDVPGYEDGVPVTNESPVGAEVLGYISAFFYLGARIPQIIKNWRSQSCEGLSLLFFMLSLLGNLSYGAGILFHSVEKNYFLTNLPWLIGSLGTMAEDVTIFVQFRMYGKGKEAEKVAGEENSTAVE